MNDPREQAREDYLEYHYDALDAGIPDPDDELDPEAGNEED